MAKQNEPKQNRLIAAALLLLVSLLSCGIWISSHHTFYYWTSPDFPKKYHRLSIGCAWGQVMFAYGWPSAVSKWWKPNTEPIFGNEPDLAPEDRALPEERTDLAHQQFSFQIDGVAVPVNYPFVTVPIWMIVATLLAVVALLIFPALRSISSQDREHRE